ncbi:MAG TPA: ATP-binding protein [Tepidisphaeraceae bacterium]|jgi:PAS domain S-box-containing protein
MQLRTKLILATTCSTLVTASAAGYLALPLFDPHLAPLLTLNRAMIVSASATLSVLFSCAFASRAVSRRLYHFTEDAEAAATGMHKGAIGSYGDEFDAPASSVNRLKEHLENLQARQISEEELLAAKRYADNIIHSMFDILIVTDPDLRIQTVNKAACESLEYSQLELVGRPIEELFKQEPMMLGPSIKAQLLSNATRDFEAVYRTAGGRLIDVLLSASTMRDNAGRPIAIITVGKDISARKRMERELLEAKATAEAGSRAKSLFVANMSHEIRTPMTAILGYADLLLHPNQTAEERRRCIQTMRRNGQHLLAIINDILDVSKIEAGKMTVERITCSPMQIVAEVAALMKIRAADKNLGFDVRYSGPIPQAMNTDPTRLRQILMNLIGNAIKFTSKGSVKVLVSLTPSPGTPGEGRGEGCAPTSAKLRFDVIDTGVGLSKPQQESLFKPFAQADSSTTRKFGGTGLGLIISKRLAQLLGGDVTVHSVEGSGSTFSLVVETGSLAGVAMIDSPAFIPTAADPHQDVTITPTMSGRVLLAEDGPDNRVLISYYLQQAGLDVTVVENGLLARDAVLQAEAHGKPFDLVLMDMQMPELDGYSATSQLRAKGYRRPIIALTAHALGGDRDKCLAAGCDEFAVKPIDQEQFFRTIRRFVHERQESSTPTGQSVAMNMAGTSDSILSKLMAKPTTAKLVEKFLAGLGQRVSALHDALQSQNLAQLKVLAHQLKGAAGGYGFPSLTEAARNLEQAAAGNADPKVLKQAFRAVSDLCTQIKTAA